MLAKVVITRFGLVPGPSVDMRRISFAKAPPGKAASAAAPVAVPKKLRRENVGLVMGCPPLDYETSGVMNAPNRTADQSATVAATAIHDTSGPKNKRAKAIPRPKGA